MLGIFNRKPTPDGLVERLKPYYGEAVRIISSIDGVFPLLYEAGIFVAAVAHLSLSSQAIRAALNDDEFEIEFYANWISYISSSYEVDGKSPSNDEIIDCFDERIERYRPLLLLTFSAGRGSSNPGINAYNAGYDVLNELYKNCTRSNTDLAHDKCVNLILPLGKLVIGIVSTTSAFAKSG